MSILKDSFLFSILKGFVFLIFCGFYRSQAFRTFTSHSKLVGKCFSCRYIVEKDEPRLDNYITGQLTSFSRSQVAKLCTLGFVEVNNVKKKKSAPLFAGDVVNVDIDQFVATCLPSIEPEDIKLDILFENEDFLIINKKAGMVVHPSPGQRNGTFVNALNHYLHNSSIFRNNQHRKGYGNLSFHDSDHLRPGIVHRLDKGTSGVLLGAKNSLSMLKLSQLFSERKISKIYIAICVGSPPDMRIDCNICRDDRFSQRMITCPPSAGKNAITFVRNLGSTKELSLLLIKLVTGRTHQIRVHMKHVGYPIFGDDLYGNKDDTPKKLASFLNSERPFLHAYELSFVNPLIKPSVISCDPPNHNDNHHHITVAAPLPQDMLQVLRSCFPTPIYRYFHSKRVQVDLETGVLHVTKL